MRWNGIGWSCLDVVLVDERRSLFTACSVVMDRIGSYLIIDPDADPPILCLVRPSGPKRLLRMSKQSNNFKIPGGFRDYICSSYVHASFALTLSRFVS